MRIFSENVQPPRETSAMAPVREPAAGGAVLHAVDSAVPARTAFKGAASGAAGTGKSPAAVANVVPPVVSEIPRKCPTEAAPADRARSAEPGDSTVRCPGPELPLATATTMSARSRLSTATVSRSWMPWAPPPRLMLTTSMPSSAAAWSASRMSSLRALSTSPGKML